MSQENVEIVKRGYAHRQATGDFLEEVIAPDFVWDMSMFGGWPEQQVYAGLEEARSFIRDWTAAFDEWEIEVDAVHDAGGNKVVGVVRQRGRSKTTGLPVEMLLAQVWTVREGLEARMEMYGDNNEALKAVGLHR
jgi:ketosteroid isomerase-like protein